MTLHRLKESEPVVVRYVLRRNRTFAPRTSAPEITTVLPSQFLDARYTQHSTERFWKYIPLYLRTTTIAQMLSVRREWGDIQGRRPLQWQWPLRLWLRSNTGADVHGQMSEWGGITYIHSERRRCIVVESRWMIDRQRQLLKPGNGRDRLLTRIAWINPFSFVAAGQRDHHSYSAGVLWAVAGAPSTISSPA